MLIPLTKEDLISANTHTYIHREREREREREISKSVQKSIIGSRNINYKRGGNQDNQRRHRMDSGFTPARQQPQPDLDDVDHGQHEEQAAHDGAGGGAQHAEPEDFEVDVGAEGLVDVLAVEQVDCQLQALGNKGGEEEEAEGDDLEDYQLPHHVDAGVAGRVVPQALLVRGGEGEAHEDGDGEERVRVDDAVQGGHVHARRRRCRG
jgi:hypothetical protein